MADTSFSDMSAADNRGCAVSEVQFLEDGSVRVCGSLHDQREFSYALPSSTSPLVGRSLPAFEVFSTRSEASTAGFSSEATEQAALDLLGERPYFVKAWLDLEQLYLLCNVDGFVVSYVTMGQQEVDALFRRASEEAAKAARLEARSTASTASTARNSQATWLSRILKGIEAGALDPPSLRSQSSEVQISSLGDDDIIGLGSDSVSYAKQTLETQLSKLAPQSTSSKQLFKQARRLRSIRFAKEQRNTKSQRSDMSPNRRTAGQSLAI
eukprot:7379697-Prymnesium_polylepis.2